MYVEIKRWEDSQGVKIPKVILDDMKIHEGDFFEIESTHSGILLKTLTKKIELELFEKENLEAIKEQNQWTQENGCIGRKFWDY
jgi:antitoxin component of MazEF toxin-antitoxin module